MTNDDQFGDDGFDLRIGGAVLDVVGALVIVLDPRGHVVRFNRACQAVTGCTLDEVKDR
jgi:PAS domain-containing protein